MPTNTRHIHALFATSRRGLAIATTLLVMMATPLLSVAQSTTEPPVYAVSDLNLRKGPGRNDAIFVVVPMGAELQRRDGTVTNDYALVSYNGITGWVVDLGLVATPEDVELANASQSAQEEPLELFGNNARVTLAPLMLRSAPDVDAETIAGMPEGSMVTLTQEGWENGYVTVDYGGAFGWAYADLLGEPDESG